MIAFTCALSGFFLYSPIQYNVKRAAANVDEYNFNTIMLHQTKREKKLNHEMKRKTTTTTTTINFTNSVKTNGD